MYAQILVGKASSFSKIKLVYTIVHDIVKQVDFEKMSRHRIQWLLACNLLSNFVCTFKNVAEGYIHAKNANMGGAVQLL